MIACIGQVQRCIERIVGLLPGIPVACGFEEGR